ncbi:MAG TPA: hypothetical protein ENN67_03290 [Firmicutes bacterium]|nr:hypothetical protein [Bacillota bacterium]
MKITRYIVVSILSGLVLFSLGCVKQTLTDKQLLQEIQIFLDTPYDPDNPDLLTPEERSYVSSYSIFHNILKVQLVDDTPQEFRKPIAAKMVKHFALTRRELGVLEQVYRLQLFVRLEVDRERSNFHIADARFENRTERVIVEEYAATRSRR